MRVPSLVALVLMAATAPVHGQRAQGGRLYELVPLEAGTSTRATDVNVRGQACGLVSEPGTSVALRWSTAAGFTPLAPAPGYPRALALGITRDGFVLGQSFSPSLSVATLWSPSGTPTALPSLGWSLVEPAAISDTGVVVGRGYASGPWQPWVWDALNGTRLLASLGFPAGATVTDVDANGVLAGAPSFGEAFLFDLASGTTTPLGTLGGDTSAALALDESGFVVGWSQTLPANEPAPFFWSPFGGMRSLGTPSGPGNVDGQALDVNRHGVVVGTFEVAPGVTHAFVWEEGPGLRDLNALVRARGGVELQSALHLSDSGWIAGIGRDHSQGGKTVGFLLRRL